MSAVAILGATSQIASDFIYRASASHTLFLYARSNFEPFSAFGKMHYDAIINCVGVGDPAKAAEMGGSIADITLQFDTLALDYAKANPGCRYIFLSSGAAYGGDFAEPATGRIQPSFANTSQDIYGAAKFTAECRHRAAKELHIVDIRLFNYFSRTQNLGARFFITDMLRALKNGETFQTSPATMTRDYLHPDDFAQLIEAILQFPPANVALDAYSRAAIEKFALLEAVKQHFGLHYEVDKNAATVNATGIKTNYYSIYRRAAKFGYKPAYTSLEGLMLEIGAILAKVAA